MVSSQPPPLSAFLDYWDRRSETAQVAMLGGLVIVFGSQLVLRDRWQWRRWPQPTELPGPAYGERAPRKREGDTGSLSSHPSVAPVEHQSTAPARSARRGSLQGRLNFRDAHADRGRTSAENWRQPIRWDRAARAVGERRRVFTGSMCDIFDNRAPEAWRAYLWRLIAATPDLTWMLLTKRPQNIAGMLPPPDWGAGWRNVWLAAPPRTKLRRRSASRPCLRYRPPRCGFYQSSRCWRRSTSVAGSVQGFGARDRGKKFHRRGPVTARPVVLRSAAALFFCASGTAVIICSECQRLASARASWLTAS